MRDGEAEVIRARLDELESELERLQESAVAGARCLIGRPVSSGTAGLKFVLFNVRRVDGAETEGGSATLTATGGQVLAVIADATAADSTKDYLIDQVGRAYVADKL
jgi:hypothetical protein